MLSWSMACSLTVLLLSQAACGIVGIPDSPENMPRETSESNTAGAQSPVQSGSGRGGSLTQISPPTSDNESTPIAPPPPPVVATNPVETRCGWFSNPTPANISLLDADREWIIGVQGGYQVTSDWPWPDFEPGEWIVTNSGSYGYGCSCMDVRTDSRTGQIASISNVRALSLATCRQDPALDQWGDL